MGRKYYAIGIDPGEEGAISFIEIEPSKGKVFVRKSIRLDKTPIRKKLAVEFSIFPATTPIFLEQVHSISSQGVSSTFKFGVNYGKVQGFLDTAWSGRDWHLISPQMWQRPTKHVASAKLETKKRTRKAFEFWFDLKGSKGVSEGEVDAAMIGLGGWLKLTGQQLVRSDAKSLTWCKG